MDKAGLRRTARDADRMRDFADRLLAYRETRLAQILFTDVDAS